EELGGVVGVARSHLQAWQQFAAEFSLETLATNLARGHRAVPAVAIHGALKVLSRPVFLVVSEHREGGVQATIRQLTLDAEFVIAAFNRLQHRTGGGEVGLWFESVGVTGIR